MRGGGPADGHPRQCHAKSMHTNKRCRRWALVNKKYCQFHGGRRPLARKEYLPSFYINHFGPTLKKKLEDWANLPHHEQVSLHEELALTRMAADQAIKLAALALEHGDEKSKLLATDCMATALERVKEMAIAVSKIEKDLDDKVSLKVVDLFIVQVMRCIKSVIPEHAAKEVCAKIEKEVRLPLPGVDPNVTIEGTVRTPDQLVREMDDTIGSGDELV